MSKINLKKVEKMVYEHWKIIFSCVISFFLISFLQHFRKLMFDNVPFYLLFATLLILGCAIVIIFLKQKKIKTLTYNIEQKKQKTILTNNLLYKIDDYSQAFCPSCYEKNRELRRMKRYYNENKECYEYSCFVCDYNECISLDKEKSPDIENIPF